MIHRVKRKIKHLWDRYRFYRGQQSAKRANRGKTFDLSHRWVILCVKRPVYVRLVRDNINSLHACNPAHTITILCDNHCEAHLRSMRLDYPRQVRIVNRFAADERPWQFLKLESLKQASLDDAILVDADTVWWQDPPVPEGIVFQVANQKFSDWPQEIAMLQDLVGPKANGEAFHYVTGLVRFPARYWTPEFEGALHDLAQRIWTYAGNPQITAEALQGLHRLCEEIAVGFTTQRFYPSQTTVLKAGDPYNDRSIMQSLYYGALNRVQ